jgi:hypothetical protein
MHPLRRIGTCFLLGALGYFSHPLSAFPQTTTATTTETSSSSPRDGQHDFDFELGTWKIHLKRLAHPLTGSNTWTEFDGTSFTRKVWGGRAELEQFETDGSAGHIEGLTLRLYDPQSHQWRLYWANSKDGTLGPPMIGEFKNGVGEFYDQESFNGRAIYVRYLWSGITPNSAHFEQSFSEDGGKTWEVNWITDQTRVSDEPQTDSQIAPAAQTIVEQASTQRDGQHDFDFDIGNWKTHTSRLVHPLTGSNDWIQLDGVLSVQKVWNGRANLAELESDGPTGHLEVLALRLYDPQSHQWSVNFATSDVGILSVPCVGEFKDGRGEFYDQEPINGRSILVRFRFWSISPNSARSEQAFSNDGGKTWETNFISEYTRTANQGVE